MSVKMMLHIGVCFVLCVCARVRACVRACMCVCFTANLSPIKGHPTFRQGHYFDHVLRHSS